MIAKLKAQAAASEALFHGERSLSGHLTDEAIAKAIADAVEAYFDALIEPEEENE